MYDNYHLESQTIRRSVIVLSVSLILVYVVLYYVKGDLWKTDIVINEIEQSDEIVINDIYGSMDTNQLISGKNILSGGEQLNYIPTTNIDSGVVNNTGVHTNMGTGQLQAISGNNVEIDIDKTIILSGTKTYYGELDFAEKLRIGYNYALVDEKGIYYLNMINHDYDWSAIVRRWSGSLYVINTDQELIANSLFGDKVTFINIPDYKNKKVLFLLDIDDQSWLLAIDYSIYHQVKPYLKSLFIY